MRAKQLPPLLQPEPARSPAGAAAATTQASFPPASGTLGPDTDRVPATGDHHGESVDVGAASFTAAELAVLKLPGLPTRRANISRLATKQGWVFVERQGRGGGRAFPLAALPTQARAEILNRRIVEQAAKAAGNEGRPRAPLATLAAMTARQSERHAARTIVLEQFDAMKGERSARAVIDVFVSAFNDGHVEMPPWARADVQALSRRTLERWLAARARGEDEVIAGRWAGGRRGVFEQSQDAADFVIGAHATQPLLSADELRGLLDTNFPQGLPDPDGVMLDLPSTATIARFVRSWHRDPANAASFAAFSDPDRAKSHHRFAAGAAAAGVVRLNQRWEVDASPADVLCTDGRRNIYVLVDVATRRLMALVTDTTRTTASLLMVARACQAWGVPETLGTDNGPDFKSAHFCICIRQLGIRHKPAPKHSPERKPFVERAIGTIQHKFMPLLPGYIGSNVADRTQIRARQAFAARLGVSDDEAFAVALSSDELQEQLTAWLANIYAHRPHAGLGGRTPHEIALELAATTEVRRAEERAIGMLLMPPAGGGGIRVVGKKAVKVDGVDYWVDRLIPGQRLQVRLDPADMGRIYLYTDTDPWRFVGIGLNPELAGLDRAELAARVRAEQAAFEKEGRARLRRLTRDADLHGVARRMIGTAPVPVAANAPANWSTPELDEALRAVDHPTASAPIAELTDRRRDQAGEETPDQRYARAKQLRGLLDDGREISAESRDWLESYEGSHEWNGMRLVEDQSA
ncbi:MAG: DDE-type integrase/transposase/recombinase [Reyranella sp.]|nr:DDE-type integrase/transposase/recombinase [Reyranella sp.]